MKQLFKNILRFCYDQDYQKSLSWIIAMSRIVSVVHHHIWTILRIPAGPLFIITDIYFGSGVSSLVLAGGTITDFFDGKAYWYRTMIGKKGWIDNLINKIKLKEKRNWIEEKIISVNFGDLLDGTADKIFFACCGGYLGYIMKNVCYFPLLLAILITDAAGNVFIGILTSKGKLDEDRVFKHLGVGKVKFAVQMLFVLQLMYAREHPFYLQDIIINFTLSCAGLLAFLSIFCKIKKSFCQKLWETTAK